MKKKRFLVLFFATIAIIIYVTNMETNYGGSNSSSQDTIVENNEVKKEIETPKQEPAKGASPKLSISAPKTTFEGQGDYANLAFKATITNHTNDFIESASVKFIVYDQNDNILRTVNSYVSDIPANGKRTATGSCYDLDNLPKNGMKAGATVSVLGW